MASCSPFEDYQVDQVLTLSVIQKRGEIVQSTSTVRARIRQLQSFRTLSCCVIVDLLGESCPENPVFLKLYDRRFSEQLRRDHGIDQWTVDVEKEYIKAVRTGAARQFLRSLQTIPNFEEETGETWDDGDIETFLTDQAHKLFEAEITVYDTLRGIQGKMVPRLVAPVHLDLSLQNDGIGHTDDAELLHIKGILLQYIDGFSLSKVQDHAPKSEWQGIVDQAVAIVQVLGDHGVLNRDVRPDNFIVQRDEVDSYRVFMIDFGWLDCEARTSRTAIGPRLSWKRTRRERSAGDEEAACQRRI
ncbi:hypothetical protein N656DRAFT_784553 [Canariomyces notabilis]|uniref:Protein kinase domain-containing protein n=1 Tax=Canariomyces notabilis TaxID=2074819 RepID=A0AAN6T8J1_9PEZI|nr:hypothetical protein N656DRAFT_784553 [Canariomyces arenarius]